MDNNDFYLNVLLPLILTWTFMLLCLRLWPRGQTREQPQYEYKSTANMLVVLVPPVHGCQPRPHPPNQVSAHITPLLCNSPNIIPCCCLLSKQVITPYCFLITPFSGYIVENLWDIADKTIYIVRPKNRSNGYTALVYNTKNLINNQKQLYDMLYSMTQEQFRRLCSTIMQHAIQAFFWLYNMLKACL